MVAPLADVRVVEVAHFVAAPSAGGLLADLGAEVIKVEVPEGEIYRHIRPEFMGIDSTFDASPGFQLNNRGKRSLTLDLKREEARHALQRVIDTADVLLTNVLPNRREKFGLDHETLLARRPELIVASLTGYGSRGGEASTPSFDYAAYWARSGLMDLMYDEGSSPAFLRPGLGDHAAGLSLVSGILAALRTRDRTGLGQYVDVSLLGVGLYVSGCDSAVVAATGQTPHRHDRSNPREPLWNHYRTSDDRWLFLVMIESDRYWPALLAGLGDDALASDPRFDQPERRRENSRELVAALDDIFASRTLADWEERLKRAGIIWAPARTMSEALEDPQVASMGYVTELTDSELGSFRSIASPFVLSDHPKPSGRAAPSLGADSAAVLAEAGLSPEEIRALTEVPEG